MPDEETTETAETPDAPADAAAPAAAKAPEAAAEESSARARRKVREGLVVSDKGDKTAIVAVTDRVRHRRYNKTVQRTTRLHAHDETNDAHVGDKVRIAETRPLSKLKRWRLVEVLERAK